MSSTTQGSFTKAYSAYDNMPYEGFSNLEMLVVERALRLAWSESSKRFYCHQIDFSSADEDGISGALMNVFDNIWSNDRHLLSELAELFQPVPEFNSQRGAVDYLGHHLKYRPDLTFRRSYTAPGMSSLNGCLFIEAKRVERSKTMGEYCGHGLKRFVDGTYAWAMPQAMMLGYVRDTGQTLPKALSDHFKRLGKTAQYNLKEGPTPFTLSRYANRTYTTEHNRTWPYPGTNKTAGPIRVHHVWFEIEN
ncbi:MAG: hypothetical protein Q8O64_17225 [Sideroxyarcus sp.]|nr:hypothetical protein [Sideroxyarcus sp.]